MGGDGAFLVETNYNLDWQHWRLIADSPSSRTLAANLLIHLFLSPARCRLGPNIKRQAVTNLNDYELVIASHLVVPENISVSWDSIAGLDHVCQEIKESLVFPVCHRDMFSGSALYQAPKGVLLYGPPGKGGLRGFVDFL